MYKARRTFSRSDPVTALAASWDHGARPAKALTPGRPVPAGRPARWRRDDPLVELRKRDDPPERARPCPTARSPEPGHMPLARLLAHSPRPLLQPIAFRHPLLDRASRRPGTSRKAGPGAIPHRTVAPTRTPPRTAPTPAHPTGRSWPLAPPGHPGSSPQPADGIAPLRDAVGFLSEPGYHQLPLAHVDPRPPSFSARITLSSTLDACGICSERQLACGGLRVGADLPKGASHPVTDGAPRMPPRRLAGGDSSTYR